VEDRDETNYLDQVCVCVVGLCSGPFVWYYGLLIRSSPHLSLSIVMSFPPFPPSLNTKQVKMSYVDIPEGTTLHEVTFGFIYGEQPVSDITRLVSSTPTTPVSVGVLDMTNDHVARVVTPRVAKADDGLSVMVGSGNPNNITVGGLEVRLDWKSTNGVWGSFFGGKGVDILKACCISQTYGHDSTYTHTLLYIADIWPRFHIHTHPPQIDLGDLSATTRRVLVIRAANVFPVWRTREQAEAAGNVTIDNGRQTIRVWDGTAWVKAAGVKFNLYRGFYATSTGRQTKDGYKWRYRLNVWFLIFTFFWYTHTICQSTFPMLSSPPPATTVSASCTLSAPCTITSAWTLTPRSPMYVIETRVWDPFHLPRGNTRTHLLIRFHQLFCFLALATRCPSPLWSCPL
jgi:hypothetical protein